MLKDTQQQALASKGIALLTEQQYKKISESACAAWDSRDYTDKSRVQLLLFEDGSLIVAEWDLYPMSGSETTEYALLRCGIWTLKYNIEATIDQHMPGRQRDQKSRDFIALARDLKSMNR